MSSRHELVTSLSAASDNLKSSPAHPLAMLYGSRKLIDNALAYVRSLGSLHMKIRNVLRALSNRSIFCTRRASTVLQPRPTWTARSSLIFQQNRCNLRTLFAHDCSYQSMYFFRPDDYYAGSHRINELIVFVRFSVRVVGVQKASISQTAVLAHYSSCSSTHGARTTHDCYRLLASHVSQYIRYVRCVLALVKPPRRLGVGVNSKACEPLSSTTDLPDERPLPTS